MKTRVQNLFLVLALLAGVYKTAAQTSFVLSSNYPVGVNPYEVAAFKNVDGKVDLASANIQDGTLTILTNNGSGIFSSNTTIIVSNYPTSIVAADVNGDGYPDLVCANFNSLNGPTYFTISVFTNNGSGGFGFNTNFSIGNYNYTLSIAAFTNVDGKVDLVAANYGDAFGYDSGLSVFTNNGGGRFGLRANYNVTNGPYGALCVTVADVNGDGMPDLITADGSYNTLTVFTNDGTGGFALSAKYNAGNRPASVTAADVNGDGKVDLICANANDNTLTVLTNNGFGIFGSNATYNVGSDPVSVTAVDVNGDRKVDLICANGGDNTLTVLTNNGSGLFVPACTNGVGGGPLYVTTADVNGDGEPDLISANQNGLSPGTVSVLFNTSTFFALPFTYTTNNGTITITGYTGTNAAVVVPDAINGLPVLSIGEEAFYSSSVVSVTIPNSVISIGDFAFSRCALTSVTIPDSVTSIGEGAFDTAGLLTNVTIGNGVTNIGAGAFESCFSLASVTIPGSVSSIGEGAFDDCINLTNISVDVSNPFYVGFNGVLFDKGLMTLLQFPGGLAGSYTVPNGVTSIGDGAFNDCLLSSVTIPNSVTSIGGTAFGSAAELTNLIVGAGVTNIGVYAFAYCVRLPGVYFQGNAPNPSPAFFMDSNVTAYYLYGTTGWGATFDGIPTSLILIPPALGISTYGGQPAVFFPTATGTNYVLQMTTNLASGPWVTVSNGVPISGIIITNPPAAAFFRLANP